MKDKKFLIVTFFIFAFVFSACQKIESENNKNLTQPLINKDTNETIEDVDFKNFTYFDESGKEILTLKNGEKPFENMKDISFSLKSIEYEDLTDDKKDEAIIRILVQYGAGSSNLIYVFTLKDKKPEMLWYLETGYEMEGYLKNVSAENHQLIIELFGNNKFVEDKGKFKFSEQNDDSGKTPTSLTKFRFKWNGEKFVLDGKPELYDYDWRKQNDK